MQENFRFKGLDWVSDTNMPSVLVGGAGGIGSWLCLALARAGFNITIMDYDSVEEHNVGGQFYKTLNNGELKVIALNKNIREFTANSINAINCTVDKQTPTTEYMFSAFDNMKARMDMFEVWKKSWNEMNFPIFIDGRLSAEQLQILCVTKETAHEYERKYLFTDNEVEEQPCTLQQTTHVAMLIAGFMTSFFTNHITNIILRQKARDVPFYFEYFIPLNLTEAK